LETQRHTITKTSIVFFHCATGQSIEVDYPTQHNAVRHITKNYRYCVQLSFIQLVNFMPSVACHIWFYLLTKNQQTTENRQVKKTIAKICFVRFMFFKFSSFHIFQQTTKVNCFYNILITSGLYDCSDFSPQYFVADVRVTHRRKALSVSKLRKQFVTTSRVVFASKLCSYNNGPSPARNNMQRSQPTVGL